MLHRFGQLTLANQSISRYLMIAFSLLALGETGHVGFRVLGYILGNINFKVNKMHSSPVQSMIQAGYFCQERK